MRGRLGLPAGAQHHGRAGKVGCDRGREIGWVYARRCELDAGLVRMVHWTARGARRPREERLHWCLEGVGGRKGGVEALLDAGGERWGIETSSGAAHGLLHVEVWGDVESRERVATFRHGVGIQDWGIQARESLGTPGGSGRGSGGQGHIKFRTKII